MGNGDDPPKRTIQKKHEIIEQWPNWGIRQSATSSTALGYCIPISCKQKLSLQ